MNKFVCVTLVSTLLTACASVKTPEVDQTQSSAAEAGLAPQTLKPGECGLFLWTAREPRTFVFFSKAESEQAQVYVNDAPQQFAIADTEGEIFGEFMTKMAYSAGNGNSTLLVSLSPGELLEQGQRTKEATLTHTDGEGWETILPVAGVRACQLE